MRNKIILSVVVSCILASLVIASSVTLPKTSISNISPIGIDVRNTSFGELVQEGNNLRAFATNYSKISTNPYVVQISCSEYQPITEIVARESAWNFIDSIFPVGFSEDLVVNSPVLSGFLPHWSFEFFNGSITTHNDVCAFIDVNAITGEIIHFYGKSPFRVDNITTSEEAENAALTFFREISESIPEGSRYLSNHDVNYSYSFSFIQAVGPILIDESIGKISLEIIPQHGRIYYSNNWVHILEIPIREVISPNGIISSQMKLALTPVPAFTDAVTESQEFWLCWEGFLNSEYVKIDALSGEIVEVVPQHGESYSVYHISLYIIVGITSVVGIISYFGMKMIVKKDLGELLKTKSEHNP